MNVLRPATWLLLSALATNRAISQQTPVMTLKIGTNVVTVSARVRDKAGKPISGLTRNDFTLEQDHKQQEIRYFSQGSDLPLTLALMVDISNSQTPFIPDEIAAGRVFFHTMLTRPEDRVALVQVDCDIRAVKPTSSLPALEKALATLSVPRPAYQCLFEGAKGGTHLFDAIVATSQQELSPQAGRRAMVLLTDGGDDGSKLKEPDAIEAAQRGNTMIYSVYYSDGSDYGGNKKALEEMAAATGGRVFTVTPAMTLQMIFSEIADDLRQQYEIGYRPPDLRPNKYHAISLQATDKEFVVDARRGYFTPK